MSLNVRLCSFSIGLILNESFLGYDVKTIYETGLPNLVRFMVDLGVYGVNWIELPKDSFTVRNPAMRMSKCRIEVDVDVKGFTSHAPSGSWSSIAPLRVLSFDIECAGRKGIFPDASIDSCIQIASVIKEFGSQAPMYRAIFCLGSCAQIPDAHVFAFESEMEMLSAWSSFFNRADPDVVIGYNISNFDFPYLLERARHLGLSDFSLLGRLKTTRSVARNSFFSSKAYGTRESKQTSMHEEHHDFRFGGPITAGFVASHATGA
jgi:DNA polymerase delta subunit 1